MSQVLFLPLSGKLWPCLRSVAAKARDQSLRWRTLGVRSRPLHLNPLSLPKEMNLPSKNLGVVDSAASFAVPGVPVAQGMSTTAATNAATSASSCEETAASRILERCLERRIPKTAVEAWAHTLEADVFGKGDMESDLGGPEDQVSEVSSENEAEKNSDGQAKKPRTRQLMLVTSPSFLRSRRSTTLLLMAQSMALSRKLLPCQALLAAVHRAWQH